jgi:predicted amidohydrolase
MYMRLVEIIAFGLAMTLLLPAAEKPPVRFAQSSFTASGGAPEGWQTWSQRPETMPRVFVDSEVSIGAPGSLAVSGDGNVAVYGGWERELTNIVPGRWYHLRASYRTQGDLAQNWQAVARVDWRNAKGQRRGQPEYAAWEQREGDWIKLEAVIQAPQDASSAKLQFFLLNAPNATVWWDLISFTEVPAPGPREVKVASVNYQPRRTGSKQGSLDAFAKLVREKIPAGTDIILLGEATSLVGSGLKYVDVAAPIPGPDTEFLGQLAREKNAYLVAGLLEREGKAIYNTSVLIGRDGKLVGKYRKVYLPREELEGGVTPGNSYPVFRTDFGRVGMMICYDVFFPDPARALAAQGAELILMPIWDGPKKLAIARALENGVFLASSGYGHPTYVMDPDGEFIAQADDDATVAFATIDLNRRYRDEWLGDMRTRRLRELRTDIALPKPGLLD